MSDLISRETMLGAIDAEFFKTDPKGEEQLGFLTCRRICRDVPAADAVEVIRCKDCAYYGKSPFGHATIGWCRIAGKHHGRDYYCADGDRKDTEV